MNKNMIDSNLVKLIQLTKNGLIHWVLSNIKPNKEQFIWKSENNLKNKRDFTIEVLKNNNGEIANITFKVYDVTKNVLVIEVEKAAAEIEKADLMNTLYKSIIAFFKIRIN
jgi:hypothetical protein